MKSLNSQCEPCLGEGTMIDFFERKAKIEYSEVGIKKVLKIVFTSLSINISSQDS